MSVGVVNKQTGDRIPTAGMPAIDDALSLSSTNPVQNAIITAALADKQDKTDNSLQTTDKTVVGAVNELKSGLTNVADDVKLNTQDLTTTSRTKNIAPMTLDNLKYYNSAGTWTDNVYVYEGITYTVNTDNDGNISSIGVNGTASGNYSHLSVWLSNIKAGSYKMNGAPTGNDYYLQLYRSGILDIKCRGSDTDVVLASDVTSVAFRIIVMGGTTANNLTYYPMLRLTTASATYAPYIPSVESRIEAVEDITQYNKTLVSSVRAFPGTTLKFDMPKDNNRIWRFVALTPDGDSLQTGYIIRLHSDTTIVNKIVEGSYTLTVDETTDEIIITLPVSGYWVYSLTQIPAAR